MPRLPHDFVRCVDCGHIYNARFRYEDVPYSDVPNLMFNKGILWRQHLDDVARLLRERLSRDPVVVEIGCGDGHMLRSLAALHPGRYIGFDPNSSVDTAGGLIEARQELFDPARHLEQLRPDLLISRHVLEHLMNPLAFVQAVEFAVSWTRLPTLLFIEVPCVDHVLELGRTSDFYYEHNSHFTTYSLRRLLERCAGHVELLETAYGGEVAYALARFEPRVGQVRLARESLAFRDRSQQASVSIRQQLGNLCGTGQRVAIWGGTGKAAAFIQQHELDRTRFPLVVDSDPQKAGTYVPGGGQQIQLPHELLEHPVDTILIATPWRAADIVLEMQSLGVRAQQVLVEYGGQLVDYFAGDHPYRPGQVRQEPQTVRLDGPELAPGVHAATSMVHEH